MTVFPFNIKSFGFSLENAYSLSQASKVVYTNCGSGSKPGSLEKIVESWGFDSGRLRCFDAGGTQAFIVGDDQKIILAFRGTEPDKLEDWATDFKIRMTSGPGGDVHRGFARALNFIWGDVEDAVEELRDNRQTLWITGHSLGAALATLATASLKFRENPVIVNGLYTFGQPRLGSERFADNFNTVFKSRAFRFVNNNDLVSRVPPSSFGYSHVGQLRYFDTQGQLHADTQLTWWDHFWDRLEGQLESYLHLTLFDGIKDHSMENYVQLMNNLFNQHCIGGDADECPDILPQS
jgi:triacylglycerol lipase